MPAGLREYSRRQGRLEAVWGSETVSDGDGSLTGGPGAAFVPGRRAFGIRIG